MSGGNWSRFIQNELKIYSSAANATYSNASEPTIICVRRLLRVIWILSSILQDYQVDEDDISMDEEEVGNGFGSQKKRKPKSSGERNSPPSSGKQSSSQSTGKQTSPQSSGKRIFHLRSDKRTSSPSSGKRACLLSSAKQPSQNADIRASLVNKDAPSDKAIGLMVASSSIMCGINEKAGRCMQLISKELFENHVFKNHRLAQTIGFLLDAVVDI